MTTSIKIEAPVFDPATGLIHVTLNTNTGEKAKIVVDFAELIPFANASSTESVDFFILASCAYGIDRFISRRAFSVDGWSRELNIEIPVSDAEKWTTSTQEIETLLSFLTGDYWTVSFYDSRFELPNTPIGTPYNETFQQVNLFSGGLDSLIGAIDFLEQYPEKKLLLVSHYDRQMRGPFSDQSALKQELINQYPDQFAHLPSVAVYLADSTLLKETTFRSRSILFIGIALLIAESKNIPIAVPENGTVSLNFPLSPSRRSACSTRTTHPSLINHIQILWSKLGINVGLSNPYEFKTKKEMVDNCRNQPLLQRIVNLSNSCGKRGHPVHMTIPASHCGRCMPCVYRRTSLLGITDYTTYGDELNSLKPFKKKKGQDIGACLEFLRHNYTDEDIKNELIVNGLKDLEHINQYVDVVKRTRHELREWVGRYGDAEVRHKAGL